MDIMDEPIKVRDAKVISLENGALVQFTDEAGKVTTITLSDAEMLALANKLQGKLGI